MPKIVPNSRFSVKFRSKTNLKFSSLVIQKKIVLVWNEVEKSFWASNEVENGFEQVEEKFHKDNYLVLRDAIFSKYFFI